MLTEKTISELKAKHPDLFSVEVDGDESGDLTVAVVRGETLRRAWDGFMELARDEDVNRVGAMKNFLRDVIVYPDRDQLNARFDQFPGLATTYFRGISVEAKGQAKVRTKKL